MYVCGLTDKYIFIYIAYVREHNQQTFKNLLHQALNSEITCLNEAVQALKGLMRCVYLELIKNMVFVSKCKLYI